MTARNAGERSGRSIELAPAIQTLLDTLLSQGQAVLGTKLAGLYLHGSLAYGDFDPATSDIDFLAVTEGELPDEDFSALQEMHAGIFSSGRAWSQKLEGAYLPADMLRRHDPHHPPVPWLGVDGHFAREKLGSDWIIQRWILRACGLVLTGPDLAGLIDPVSPDELRYAVRASLREWWSPPFPSPERFESDEYRAYAVLTMCRSLYVLETGRVASKPQAARWAREHLDGRWTDLVAAASAWQAGQFFDPEGGTFDLIQYTLERLK